MKKKITLPLALATFSILPVFAYRDSADMGEGNSGMGFQYFLGLMVIIAIIGAIFNKK